MVRYSARFHQRVSWLAAAVLYAAVLLRTLLIYGSGPELPWLTSLLAAWLVLALIAHLLSDRARRYFPIYLAIQTGLVMLLLTAPGNSDLFATLLVIVSIQATPELGIKIAVLLIGIWATATAALLFRQYGGEAVALCLLYASGSLLVGSFSVAIRRSQTAQGEAEALASQLEKVNAEIRSYSSQIGELTAARERNRFVRDLHDSLTQTVFSMSLTAQSAAVLWERDRERVKGQLERLSQLVDGAQSEMRLLTSELQDSDALKEGLVSAIRTHLCGRRLSSGFSVSLTTDGERLLTPEEERGLFRIVQEALNNVVKHAGAPEATIDIHLETPFWIEVKDQGRGFDLPQGMTAGLGLHNMYERAAEIGWDLRVITGAGQGTRVRMEKKPS